MAKWTKRGESCKNTHTRIPNNFKYANINYKIIFRRIQAYWVKYTTTFWCTQHTQHTHTPLKNTLHKRNGFKLLFDFWLSSMYFITLLCISCLARSFHLLSVLIFSYTFSFSLWGFSFVFLIIEIKFDCLINVPSGYNIHVLWCAPDKRWMT